MNPNGMGGMPNGFNGGMMGMMANGQMNPNVARMGQQGQQGMQTAQGFQAMQQAFMKHLFNIDKSTLPQGWQQILNPTERVKNVNEM